VIRCNHHPKGKFANYIGGNRIRCEERTMRMNFTPLQVWRIAFYLTGAAVVVIAAYSLTR
jgi:hypothetical protein